MLLLGAPGALLVVVLRRGSRRRMDAASARLERMDAALADIEVVRSEMHVKMARAQRMANAARDVFRRFDAPPAEEVRGLSRAKLAELHAALVAFDG